MSTIYGILSSPDQVEERDQHSDGAQYCVVPVSIAGGGGHSGTGSQTRGVSPTFDNLRELHRQRQYLHNAEKSLTLRIKAHCRRLIGGSKIEAEKLYKTMLGKGESQKTIDAQVGGALALAIQARVVSEPFIRARAVLKTERSAVEKRMVTTVETMPICVWTNSIHGFGLPSLAALVGECGDLGNYPTVAKLWKRLGLAVIDGQRQRCVEGAEALKHGYSPSRRAVMWNVGQTIFKAQSQRVDKETGEVLRAAGEYRRIYDERKAYELQRTPDMKPAHAHNRATRYMEKRIIKDLWRAWRRSSGLLTD